jgi:hypothetical protein
VSMSVSFVSQHVLIFRQGRSHLEIGLEFRKDIVSPHALPVLR